MFRSYIFILLLLSILTFIPNLHAQLADSPWPTFGGDSRHSGQSQFKGPESPYLKWKFKTENGISSSPVVGKEGEMYIGSWDGYLYAINPDGSLRWRFYTSDKINSTPTLSYDGTIYIDSRDGYLYAVNPDGTEKWKFYFGTDYYLLIPSPNIGADGTIYVCSDTLYAVNPDGSLKWKYEDPGNLSPGVQSSAAIGPDGTLYINRDKYIQAISNEGNFLWQYYLGYYSFSSIAVGTDGSVYSGSDSYELVAVSSNGSGKWRFKAKSPYVLSPTVGADGNIYVNSEDYRLYALSPEFGSVKWSFVTNSLIRSSPAIDSEGTLYINSFDKHLYAVNSDGSMKWKFKTAVGIVSSPAISADGTLYFATYDGYVFAVGDATKNPQVDIYANDSSFWKGETASINVKVENTTNDTVDMYACIVLGGNYYWYPSWNNDPKATDIEHGTWDETILSFLVSDTHPAGYYTFYTAITEHGTTNIFHIDSVTIRIE